MRGVTEAHNIKCSIVDISTHTPHARRDVSRFLDTPHHSLISTHTPHARRDSLLPLISKNSSIFQLTRLMRGVTLLADKSASGKTFQLTRLMRGVTSMPLIFSSSRLFQLTRLMRGVTHELSFSDRFSEISTHTPHARRD